MPPDIFKVPQLNTLDTAVEKPVNKISPTQAILDTTAQDQQFSAGANLLSNALQNVGNFERQRRSHNAVILGRMAALQKKDLPALSHPDAQIEYDKQNAVLAASKFATGFLASTNERAMALVATTIDPITGMQFDGGQKAVTFSSESAIQVKHFLDQSGFTPLQLAAIRPTLDKAILSADDSFLKLNNESITDSVVDTGFSSAVESLRARKQLKEPSNQILSADTFHADLNSLKLTLAGHKDEEAIESQLIDIYHDFALRNDIAPSIFEDMMKNTRVGKGKITLRSRPRLATQVEARIKDLYDKRFTKETREAQQSTKDLAQKVARSTSTYFRQMREMVGIPGGINSIDDLNAYTLGRHNLHTPGSFIDTNPNSDTQGQPITYDPSLVPTSKKTSAFNFIKALLETGEINGNPTLASWVVRQMREHNTAKTPDTFLSDPAYKGIFSAKDIDFIKEGWDTHKANRTAVEEKEIDRQMKMANNLMTGKFVKDTTFFVDGQKIKPIDAGGGMAAFGSNYRFSKQDQFTIDNKINGFRQQLESIRDDDSKTENDKIALIRTESEAFRRSFLVGEDEDKKESTGKDLTELGVPELPDKVDLTKTIPVTTNHQKELKEWVSRQSKTSPEVSLTTKLPEAGKDGFAKEDTSPDPKSNMVAVKQTDQPTQPVKTTSKVKPRVQSNITKKQISFSKRLENLGKSTGLTGKNLSEGLERSGQNVKEIGQEILEGVGNITKGIIKTGEFVSETAKDAKRGLKEDIENIKKVARGGVVRPTEPPVAGKVVTAELVQKIYNTEESAKTSYIKNFNQAASLVNTGRISKLQKANIETLKNNMDTSILAFEKEMKTLNLRPSELEKILIGIYSAESSFGIASGKKRSDGRGATGELQVKPQTFQDVIKQGQFGPTAAKLTGLSLATLKKASLTTLQPLLNDPKINTMVAIAKMLQGLKAEKDRIDRRDKKLESR